MGTGVLYQVGHGDMDDYILGYKKGKGIMFGKETLFGIVLIEVFPSFEDLRRFAMGMLGYCDYFDPEVPEVFLRAFNNEEDNNAT